MVMRRAPRRRASQAFPARSSAANRPAKRNSAARNLASRAVVTKARTPEVPSRRHKRTALSRCPFRVHRSAMDLCAWNRISWMYRGGTIMTSILLPRKSAIFRNAFCRRRLFHRRTCWRKAAIWMRPRGSSEAFLMSKRRCVRNRNWPDHWLERGHDQRLAGGWGIECDGERYRVQCFGGGPALVETNRLHATAEFIVRYVGTIADVVRRYEER